MEQTRDASTWPIGVRLFNRPECAQKLLQSLKQQTLEISPQSIFFIVDGYAGSLDEQRGKPDQTGHVGDLIRSAFPGAYIEQCSKNIGIGQTAFALQAKVFAEQDAQWAIFLEEDIVLAPEYLQALHHMIDLADDFPEVVKVAANQTNLNYINLPPKSDRQNFYLGQGTKAFAERRSYFSERKHLTEIYLRTIAGRQYSDRDESEVFATLAEHGIFTIMGNNDVVHDRIAAAMKKLHIASPKSLLQDVGTEGETNFVLPEIRVPGWDTANVFQTTHEDLLQALPHLQAEAQTFEYKFFKDFWSGYMVSKSGRLAMNVLISKALKFLGR